MRSLKRQLREILEETGINEIFSIYKLSHETNYLDKNKVKVNELLYAVRVPINSYIRLNEESVDYDWLLEKDFYKKCFWYEDRKSLKFSINEVRKL